MTVPVENAGATPATDGITGGLQSSAGSARVGQGDGSWQAMLAELWEVPASSSDGPLPANTSDTPADLPAAAHVGGPSVSSSSSPAQFLMTANATVKPAGPSGEGKTLDAVESGTAKSRPARRVPVNDDTIQSDLPVKKAEKSASDLLPASLDQTWLPVPSTAITIQTTSSTQAAGADTKVDWTPSATEPDLPRVSAPGGGQTLPALPSGLVSKAAPVESHEFTETLVAGKDTVVSAIPVPAASVPSHAAQDPPQSQPVVRTDEQPAVQTPPADQKEVVNPADLPRAALGSSPVPTRSPAVMNQSSAASASSSKASKVSLGDARPGGAPNDTYLVRSAPVQDTTQIVTQYRHEPTQPMASSTMGSHASSFDRDPFAALDASNGPSHATWTHANASRAEAGYLDPDLGWVSVRAEVHGAGVHASVVPSSGEAASVLGSHMAALHAYMTEHQSPATVTLSTPPSGGWSLDTAPNHQSGYQPPDQNERPSSGTRTPEVDTVPVQTASKTSSHTLLPAALYGKGARISVMA